MGGGEEAENVRGFAYLRRQSGARGELAPV